MGEFLMDQTNAKRKNGRPYIRQELRSRYFLSFRFLLLFFISFLLGRYAITFSGIDLTLLWQDYLQAFQADRLMHFLIQLLKSSPFEYWILLIAVISVLTFFCSAILHLCTLVCGFMGGIYAGVLLDASVSLSDFAIAYIIYCVFFALLCALSFSRLLKLNRLCLLLKRDHAEGKKVAVSPLFYTYIIQALKTFALFVLIRLFYGFALLIINYNR